MQRLREGRAFAVLALYALVLEIFFGTMHAAATAAAAAGPVRTPQSLIFMICTPQGLRPATDAELATPDRDGSRTPARKAASDFCPVCGSTAVSPFSVGRSPVVAVGVPHVHIRFAPPASQLPAVAPRDSARIRAPPAC